MIHRPIPNAPCGLTASRKNWVHFSSPRFCPGWAIRSSRAESERARHDRLILVDSTYRQPFGTFTGSIAGITLREGYGVMESHDVRVVTGAPLADPVDLPALRAKGADADGAAVLRVTDAGRLD